MTRFRLLLSGLLTLLTASVAAAQDESPRFGLVTVSMASLRNSPSHASELETQALCGTPVEILGEDDGWLKVRMPDGYVAYAHPDHIALKTYAEMAAWRSSPRLIVTSLQPWTIIADTLAVGPRNTVSDTSLCCIYEGCLIPGARFAELRFPDGRRGYLPASIVAPFDEWANTPATPERVIATSCSLLGTSYLWGGTTRAGVDCSGLTQLSYMSAGILLPRNASQQALVGEPVDVDSAVALSPADLIFFASTDTPRITHVALSDRDRIFIHSLGTVHVNSLEPAAADYLPRRAVKATRILIPAPDGSYDPAPGIIRLASSPLYFDRH